MDKKSLEKLGKILWEEVRAHWALIFLMVVYCGVVIGLGRVSGNAVSFFLYSEHFLIMIALVGIWFVYRRAAKLAGNFEKGKFLPSLKADLMEQTNLNQAVGGVLLFLLFTMYFSVFQSAKVMIPSVNPFVFDTMFAAMDRQFHGGTYPHELLMPFLGSPKATYIIQFFYNLWFPMMLGILAWQMFDRSEPVLRMRFLISFALCWFVIGTLGAVFLSSAGPVYFDRVTGLEGPYQDQMAFLRSVYDLAPLFTLDLQEMLWETYTGGDLQSGSGISAMPSVHVSMAVLLFLFARHKAVWMGVAMGVFALLIQLGSVHLAWHYAVDGYFGAMMMVAIWWGVGLFYPAPKAAVLKPALDTGQ